MPFQRGARRHKYDAVRTEVDGIKFASKAEAHRYGELKLLQKAGEIHGLTLQPEYPLCVYANPLVIVDGVPGSAMVGIYRADFHYCECRRGDKCDKTRIVVEDVKGFKTPLYKWKKKHVMAQYGIEIKEV